MATLDDIGDAIGRLEKTIQDLGRETRYFSDALERLTAPVETALARLQETSTGVVDAAHAAPDAARDAVEQRFDAIQALVIGPHVFDEATDEATAAIGRLQAELTELKVAADAGITAATAAFQEGAANTAERGEALLDFVDDDVVAAGEALLSDTVEQLMREIGELPEETIALIEEQFEAELEELMDMVAEQAERAHARVGDLAEELKDRIEERGEMLFREDVREFGETVITNTLNEVIDDVFVTQLSAQLTGMLSGYLPQLIVAKNVVGGVRRGLEIMRAGV